MLNTPTVLSSAIAAFAFSLGLNAHAADAIKVGVVTPLSGSYAPIGKQVRWGAELAVKGLENAQALHLLIEMASGRGASVRPQVEARAQEITKEAEAQPDPAAQQGMTRRVATSRPRVTASAEGVQAKASTARAGRGAHRQTTSVAARTTPISDRLRGTARETTL